MSNYLRIVEKAKTDEASPSTPDQRERLATKATEATKAPAGVGVRADSPCDKSDERSWSFAPLTVSEALAEISGWGTGASRNAALYRRGELSEEKAVEYVACAILARRGASFKGWKRHAPAVRKALSLCIHELDPKVCKVCNGYAQSLIENQGDAERGRWKEGNGRSARGNGRGGAKPPDKEALPTGDRPRRAGRTLKG